MYCWKCGSQNPDESAYCSRCGAKLTQVVLGAEACPQDSATVEESAAPTTLRDQKAGSVSGQTSSPKPTGVDGWLSFFCFCVSVIGPLGLVGWFITLLESGPEPVLVVFDFLALLALAVYSLVTGIRIWMRRPDAIRQAKIYLILQLSLSLVAAVVTAAGGGSMERPRVILVTAAAFFAIWWLYLSYSRRVRSTFDVTTMRNLQR